jgi:HSP20 family protein
MSRLFDNWYRPARYRADSENLDWAPVVDILEADEHVEIRAEIPGLSEKDVQVSVTDDVLTLKGEKTQETEDTNQKYHRVERSYGRFQRSFTLPANLDPEDIKAKFTHGVLTVSIPKVKEVEPKEVQISVE